MEGTASLPHCTPTRRSMPARRSAGAFLCGWRKNVWRVPLMFMYMYMLYVLAECWRGVPYVRTESQGFCLSPGRAMVLWVLPQVGACAPARAPRCKDSRCVSNFIMGVQWRLGRSSDAKHESFTYERKMCSRLLRSTLAIGHQERPGDHLRLSVSLANCELRCRDVYTDRSHREGGCDVYCLASCSPTPRLQISELQVAVLHLLEHERLEIASGQRCEQRLRHGRLSFMPWG